MQNNHPYIYTPPLLNHLPINTPGTYALVGGGLVGKTTLVKLWVNKLIASGVSQQHIHSYTSSVFDNYHSAITLLQQQLSSHTSNTIQYIILDDITDLFGWEKIVNIFHDKDLATHTVLMLVSSDRQQIEKVKPTIFHLYPLSFSEYVNLKTQHLKHHSTNLFDEFNHYLLHGGYHIAITEYLLHGRISNETLALYSDWLFKQITCRGKQANFLLEILGIILKNNNYPVTWNALTRELSINHPKTIGDYVELLESLDAILIQSALLEKSLSGAPKKARKLMFFDPFIFHAIRARLHKSASAYQSQMLALLKDTDKCTTLIKTCTISHYKRFYPTYYIQDDGDIDLAYVTGSRFQPIIITWSNQLRPKDLKQILTYPSGKILTKSSQSGIIEHIRTEPLPQALMRLQDYDR